MPVITRLVQGKKNPNRVNIYLDGAFSFALSIDEVVKNGLKKGLNLTDEKINALIETDINDKAYSKILNYISYRPRTIKEVKDRLRQYEVDESIAQNNIINKLVSSGYLNDAEFAKWFISSRNEHRPRSLKMLSQELRAKGVPSEVILTVLPNVADESITIRRILSKKLKNNRVLENIERQKIYSFLSRQGFPWEKVKEVVKQWESE